MYFFENEKHIFREYDNVLFEANSKEEFIEKYNSYLADKKNKREKAEYDEKYNDGAVLARIRAKQLDIDKNLTEKLFKYKFDFLNIENKLFLHFVIITFLFLYLI